VLDTVVPDVEVVVEVPVADTDVALEPTVVVDVTVAAVADELLDVPDPVAPEVVAPPVPLQGA